MVSVYLENRSEVALQNKIDRSDYDETQLIELRVPLNAPYLSGNSTEFETFHGELELSGIHYKYVKRKVENGELVLLCLPDQSKTKFQNSRAEFFKLVNDLNHSPQGKEKNTNNSSKTFAGDYIQDNNFLSLAANQSSTASFSTASNAFDLAGHVNTLKRPPRG